MQRLIIFFIPILFALQSCQQTTGETEEIAPGIETAYMDTTTSPKQDFFRYVNGQWLDDVDLPADRGRWGSFDELRKMTSDNVLKLLDGSGDKDFDQGSDQYKAYVFYQTAMDTAHANEMGILPLQPILTDIEAVNTVETLQKFIENTEAIGLGAFIRFGVSSDLRKSDQYAAYLGNGSLGLPDRDYYLKEDDESVRIRGEYQTHVAKMLPFVGYSEEEATMAAEKILAIETAMATPRMDKVQRRNPLLRYNKRSIDDLKSMMPEFDWQAYFANIGVEKLDTVIVSEPNYISALSKILKNHPQEDWQHYLKWTALRDASSELTQEIDAASFDFYGKTLRGLEEQRAREERVVDVCNRTIGEALGKLYVDAYFPEEAKAKAKEMVDYILMAFEERIENLSWMTDSTKLKAKEKLANFTVKIGYPDEWKDYGAMDIKGKEDGGNYLNNMYNVSKFFHQRDLGRIGEKVDTKEWFMPPQMVNAYYNPTQNEIVFPAAILQPPFYNYQADAAVNFGGIGAVIGHEISHGFDDQGSRFDAQGNMNNWWTDTDREQFEALHQKLIDQFDSYEPFPGVNVNGAFTLGENIGDLGGLNSAYDGLQDYMEKNGRPDLIDGYTPEQRFFISWGTIWRTKYRDEALKTQIKTDPHSPGMYRAVGPLSNFGPFYTAFDIKEGDETYKPDSLRVAIW